MKDFIWPRAMAPVPNMGSDESFHLTPDSSPRFTFFCRWFAVIRKPTRLKANRLLQNPGLKGGSSWDRRARAFQQPAINFGFPLRQGILR